MNGGPVGRSLFGTDGVRGTANVWPMTVEVALQLGQAVAHVFRGGRGSHRILIGKDTRLSGYMFEDALAAPRLRRGVHQSAGAARRPPRRRRGLAPPPAPAHHLNVADLVPPRRRPGQHLADDGAPRRAPQLLARDGVQPRVARLEPVQDADDLGLRKALRKGLLEVPGHERIVIDYRDIRLRHVGLAPDV